METKESGNKEFCLHGSHTEFFLKLATNLTETDYDTSTFSYIGSNGIPIMGANGIRSLLEHQTQMNEVQLTGEGLSSLLMNNLFF